jgi:hypothetical protein
LAPHHVTGLEVGADHDMGIVEPADHEPPWYRHWVRPSAVVRRTPGRDSASRAMSSICSTAGSRLNSR